MRNVGANLLIRKNHGRDDEWYHFHTLNLSFVQENDPISLKIQRF